MISFKKSIKKNLDIAGQQEHRFEKLVIQFEKLSENT